MKILITGGAGFLGTNLAEHMLKKGHKVMIYDNLSRPGSEINLNMLKTKYPELEIFSSHHKLRKPLKRLSHKRTRHIQPRKTLKSPRNIRINKQSLRRQRKQHTNRRTQDTLRLQRRIRKKRHRRKIQHRLQKTHPLRRLKTRR